MSSSSTSYIAPSKSIPCGLHSRESPEYQLKGYKIHKAARAPEDQVEEFREVLEEVTNGYCNNRRSFYIPSPQNNHRSLKARIPHAQDGSILDALSSWDLNKYTALHYAVQLGHKNIFECILDVPGAQVAPVKDYAGRSALHWAAHLGRYDLLKQLCNARAGIIAQDRFAWTPLHYICTSEDARNPHKAEEVVKAIDILIAEKDQRGETLKIWLARDLRRRTPLHLAARYGVTKRVFEKLLSLDSDPRFSEMRDIRGWNVLHWATFAGQIELVETLLKGHEARGKDNRVTIKIDANVTTKDGWSPLDLTAMAHSAEWAENMTKILQKYGAKSTKSAEPPKSDGQGLTQKFINDYTSAISTRDRANSSPESAGKSDTKFDTIFDPIPCRKRLERFMDQQRGVKLIFQRSNSGSELENVLEQHAMSFSTIPLAFGVRVSEYGPGGFTRELLMDLGVLLLYDRIVIIDDSTSVGYSPGGLRRKSVLNVLQNLEYMNKCLRTKNTSLKSTQKYDIVFASSPTESIRKGGFTSEEGLTGESRLLEKKIDDHAFYTTSVLGTGLWKSVVEPLERQEWELKRPLLVTILTDGEIDPVEVDILEKSIQYIARKVKERLGGEATGAVFFQFIDINAPNQKDGGIALQESNTLCTIMNHTGLGAEVDYVDWGQDQWEFSKIYIKDNTTQCDRMRHMMLGQVIPNYIKKKTEDVYEEDG